MIEDIPAVKQLLHDVVLFSQHASGITLRRYQIEVARAVDDSVVHRHLESYLLVLFSLLEAEMVKVSPT